MKTQTRSNPSHEFSFPDLDTLVLVENFGEDVLIRATRNTFSEQRKIYFIRELAAEGFIPDGFQRLPDLDPQSSKVRWLVDFSWLKLHQAIAARANKFMIRLLASAALVWLGLMITVCFHGLT